MNNIIPPLENNTGKIVSTANNSIIWIDNTCPVIKNISDNIIAENLDFLRVNSSNSSITITLPDNPLDYTTIIVEDSAGYSNINPIKVQSSKLINNLYEEMTLQKYQNIIFTYFDNMWSAVFKSNIDMLDNNEEYISFWIFDSIIDTKEYLLLGNNLPSSTSEIYDFFINGKRYTDFLINTEKNILILKDIPQENSKCYLRIYTSKKQNNIYPENCNTGENFYFNTESTDKFSWIDKSENCQLIFLNSNNFGLPDISKISGFVPLKNNPASKNYGGILLSNPNTWYYVSMADTDKQINYPTFAGFSSAPPPGSYNSRFVAEFGTGHLFSGGGYPASGPANRNIYCGYYHPSYGYMWTQCGVAPFDMTEYNCKYISLKNGGVCGFPAPGKFGLHYIDQNIKYNQQTMPKSFWSNVPFDTTNCTLIQLEDERILVLGYKTCWFGTINNTNISWIEASTESPIRNHNPSLTKLKDGKILVTRYNDENEGAGDNISTSYLLGTINNFSISWERRDWNTDINIKKQFITQLDCIPWIDNRVILLTNEIDDLNAVLSKPKINVYEYYSSKIKIDNIFIPDIKFPLDKSIDVSFNPDIIISKSNISGQLIDKIEVQVSKDEKFDYIEQTTDIINYNNDKDFIYSPTLDIESKYYVRSRIHLNITGWSAWNKIEFTTQYADEFIVKTPSNSAFYVSPTGKNTTEQISIDWGDGTFTNNIKGAVSHTYSTIQNRKVIIRGNCSLITFSPSYPCISEVISINNKSLISLADVFNGQSKLVKLPKNLNCPNVTSLANTWLGCIALTEFNVDLNNLSLVTSLANTWKDCTNLKSFDTNNIKSLVQNKTLEYTWSGCSSLISFDTTPLSEMTKVTSLIQTWNGCKSINSFNCSSLAKMINVTTLSYTWNGCSSLTSFDTTPLNMPLVTNLNNTWNGCSSLTSFDTTPLNMPLVTNLNNTWNGCSSLTSFDTKGLSTMKNVTTLASTWYNCSSLISFDTTLLNMPVATTLSTTWSNCSSLIDFDTTGLLTMKNVTTLASTWNGCSSLTSFDTTPLSSSNKIISLSGTWKNCSNLISFNEIGLSGLILCSNVTNTWENCTSLINFDTTGMSNDTSVLGGTGSVSFTSAWSGCINLLTFNPEGLSKCNIYNMVRTWFGCKSLENFDGTKLGKLEKLYDLSYAWYDCSSLENFDTTGWNLISLTSYTSLDYTWSRSGIKTFNATGIGTASKITTALNYTWSECPLLETFDTTPMSGMSKLTSLSYTWSKCPELKTFNPVGLPESLTSMNLTFMSSGLVSFDTTNMSHLINLTTLQQTWDGCSKLVDFNPSGLTNLPKLTTIAYMLMNCTSLINLDFDVFPTAKITYCAYMCFGCKNLEGKDTTTFRTKIGSGKTTAQCFRGCLKLPDYTTMPAAWK